MTRRLLVVDDEPDVREVAAASLEVMGGFAVRTAGSGAAALAALHEELPDAVLLDVMMPGMDGPSTLEAIRADADIAGVPVVMFTARSPTKLWDRIRAAGIAGVIEKPFDPVALSDEVGRLLGWTTPA